MGDNGTIVEIEPEDGLGWIEMEDKSRVRFGGTACKGFVPAIGMVVKVLGTRPGYRGILKATGLERVADAPRAAFAVEAGAAEPAPPRTALQTMQTAAVPMDALLQAVLGHADGDDAFYADLIAAGFEVQTLPGPQIGCPNPWFYGVGKDAGGGAFGLYAHPMFQEYPAPPWVFWDAVARTLRLIAGDSDALFPTILANATSTGADAATIARLRASLVQLGMSNVEGHPMGEGEKVAWLPPDEVETRPLDDYLAETDGGEMERGLLAHAYQRRDASAGEALRSIYEQWGWSLPAWAG